MLRIFVRTYPLFTAKSEATKSFFKRKLFRRSVITTILGGAAYYFNNKKFVSFEDQEDCYYSEDSKPIIENYVVAGAKYILRFIQLSLIFTPSLVCLPLYCFQSTRDFWLSIFLRAIMRAGLVWIKTFQYLSHRRDVLGPEMAEKFEILRQDSPEHSYEQTRKIIKKQFNQEIEDFFEEFETTPIASGSVSQVYKAKKNGMTVAVKIKHPSAGENLERDIELLFFFNKIASKISKKLTAPITQQSLKRILKEQIFFKKEKRNLDKFNTMVVDKDISFPKAYPQSTNDVLIEDYIDGKTIAYYENHYHKLNKVIAMIGAKGFFSMLMQHNFVHADCHAGNLLIKISDEKNILRVWKDSIFRNVKNYILSKVIKYGFDSKLLQKLSQQNYQYEKSAYGLLEAYKLKLEIVLIDVGMTVRLNKEKKRNLQQFLTEIIKGDPKKCAEWIFKVSQQDGQNLQEGNHLKYLSDLETMFTRVHKTSLEHLEAMFVLNEMLGVVRQYNMKIDGEISVLLTNMLVLESIAKDLDPSINILRCAIPYLQYKQ